MAKLASSASERRKRGLTVLDGAHLVGAFLEAGHAVDTLMVSRAALQRAEVARLAQQVPEAQLITVADTLFESLSTVDSSTGVLAAVAVPKGKPVPADADLILLLEDVQDPGNVGTLVRSAAAVGAGHVLLSPACAFAWSLKTVRAAMGAHFAVNIREGVDLVEFLRGYRGTSVALVGAAAGSLYEADLHGPVAIVVGNEGAGLSVPLRQSATIEARIPMPGKVESLNAGIAGSLGLVEALRQRGAAKKGKVA